MSTPTADQRNANYLSYGFLAARAEKASILLQEGQALSPSDKEALHAAADFLSKVSTGANFLTSASGQFQSNDLVSALDALDLAIDSIQTMSDRIKNNEIGKLFAEVAETVSNQIENPKALSGNEKSQVQLFQAFFDALYQYVSSVLERETPLLGSSGSRESTGPALS